MRPIPQSLLDKIKKQNQTIYEGAEPKMSIAVARARSSVRDSSYFMIEKIREKEGITDVAVSARRLKPYGAPDRIYGIHIDNGIAKTSLREYPDKLKEHWKHQFDIEQAKAVSIVFDGRWQLNKYKRWGMTTDEVPWIFWIGTDDKLYTQYWNDEDTKYKIADDVVRLDTMRGWIPAQAGHTDDQGIIVAYVKTDGKVYYRNYCMQSDGELFIWESEKQVEGFGTNNLGIRLFRANDFRVGFIAEKAADNLMALTARNWVGMSIPVENLIARLKAEIELIKIELIETGSIEYLTAGVDAEIELIYALSDNEFTEAYNSPITKINEDNEEYDDWGYTIYAKTQHRFGDVITNIIDETDFTVIDEKLKEFNVLSVEKINNYLYRFDITNFNNAYGDITLRFLGSGNTKGGAGQDLDEFELLFTPLNLVSTEIEAPKVNVIRNDGNEGEKIVIEFSEDLIGDVSDNVTAFEVSGKERIHSGGDLIDKKYIIKKIEKYNDNGIEIASILLLTMKETFRNVEGELLVKYDSIKGNLEGIGDSVSNFSESFEPVDLIPNLNPWIKEYLTAKVDADIDLILLESIDAVETEHLTAEVSAQIQLWLLEDAPI